MQFVKCQKLKFIVFQCVLNQKVDIKKYFVVPTKKLLFLFGHNNIVVDYKILIFKDYKRASIHDVRKISVFLNWRLHFFHK